MKSGLTPRQADVLGFLRRWADRHPEIGPSLDDVVAGAGLSSRGHASRMIARLVERGYVVRAAHRARSLRLIDGPEPAAAPPARYADHRPMPGPARDLAPAFGLAQAARALLDAIVSEDPDGDGTAVVSAAALGDLDLALAEFEAR